MLYVNNELVTPDAFARRFGLEVPKGTELIVFEQMPSTKVDTLNGGAPITRRKSILKDFIGTDANGEGVRVTLSSVPLKKDAKTDEWKSPDKARGIQFHTRTLHKDPIRDKEEILLLMMHPENIESPFHKNSRKKPLYRKQDLAKDAKKNMEMRQLKAKYLHLINSWDGTLEELRNMAAGMDVHNVSNMGEDQLKDALMAMVERDAKKFHQAWETKSTSFRGIIKVAKEKGVISIVTTNGLERIHTKVGAEDGREKEVAVMPHGYTGGTDAFIFDTYTNRFEELFIPLKNHIDGKPSGDVNTKMDKLKDNELSLKEKVEKFYIFRQLIIKDDEQGSHCYQKLKNEERALFMFEDVDKYLDETVSFLEDKANNGTLTSLWLIASKKLK